MDLAEFQTRRTIGVDPKPGAVLLNAPRPLYGDEVVCDLRGWVTSAFVTAAVCISRDGWRSPVPQWWINLYLAPFMAGACLALVGVCVWGVVVAWRWAGRWSERER